MAERIVTRLFIETALSSGATVSLSPDHAHFLRSVLRSGPGAKLALFNGVDGEWLAEISALGKKHGEATLLEQRREQTEPGDLSLIFAPVKKAPLDFLIQKAVELGVTGLHPVTTERTQTDRLNTDRLRTNAIEAAKQCERLDVPRVHPLEKLDAILAGWPEENPLLVCAEAGEAKPIAKALSALNPARSGRVSGGLMTGPEGGFSPQELVILRERPFVTLVGLGPRILRAETAAIAALTLWQAIVGDMGQRPPFR
ncbi:MAG: 16S rRNA (uracil(1498)-N(3))-methyltransferase [Alphaproteobacteria bacterium]